MSVEEGIPSICNSFVALFSGLMGSELGFLCGVVGGERVLRLAGLCSLDWEDCSESTEGDGRRSIEVSTTPGLSS